MNAGGSRRAALIVLDGVGLGAAPDAEAYGDSGSDTLGNVARAVGGLTLPNLERLGLGCCGPIQGVRAVDAPAAAWGTALPASAGKDSTTGHWELCGVTLTRPFATYPGGFPPSFIEAFSAATGRGVLGNRPASGTVILDELGVEHVTTGQWIVYTSADSVCQIAAHESVVPVEELYRACEIARQLLSGDGPGPARHRATLHRRGRELESHRPAPRLQCPSAGGDPAGSARGGPHSPGRDR